MDDPHLVECFESAEGLNRHLDAETRWRGAVLLDPLLNVGSIDELPHHVVGAVIESGEVIEHGQIAMLDHRRQLGFMEKSLEGPFVAGDVGTHDLDHAQLAEMDMAN